MYRVLFLMLFLTSHVDAASIRDKNHGTLLVSEVTSIYDGDTFRANIKGLHSLIGERISIRVAGIDTPEIRGKCKKEKDLARRAKKVTVEMLRSGKVIELRNTKRGKYFRIVADVFVDDKKLSDTLIASDLAVSYDGGTKAKDWCL
ncbi:thermonuclease family protein [Pseudoalteromonas sp. CH_XMU1449-3]|uniref:thermonuclease family protein n=1 Tax=Pseudoalteromonas sp. CH_XMU1449-3 TaxID=3107774 RepID=UPI0030086987